jgi:hypothetical protein
MHLSPTESVFELTAPSFWEAQVCPNSMKMQMQRMKNCDSAYRHSLNNTYTP